MIFCKHKYKMQSNWSYREVVTNNRIHDITLVCSRCGKVKCLPKFYTPNNSGLN